MFNIIIALLQAVPAAIDAGAIFAYLYGATMASSFGYLLFQIWKRLSVWLDSKPAAIKRALGALIAIPLGYFTALSGITFPVDIAIVDPAVINAIVVWVGQMLVHALTKRVSTKAAEIGTAPTMEPTPEAAPLALDYRDRMRTY